MHLIILHRLYVSVSLKAGERKKEVKLKIKEFELDRDIKIKEIEDYLFYIETEKLIVKDLENKIELYKTQLK